jgi:hypothetical protein
MRIVLVFGAILPVLAGAETRRRFAEELRA